MTFRLIDWKRTKKGTEVTSGLIRTVMAAVFWLPFFIAVNQDAVADDKPNILFIAVDDLRPELGCYGATHIHSPNIDGLAESGRKFLRAYCQQAVCNPSRTSLMTGRRPDSIGVTGNHSHFRTNHPDIVTLPQFFKNQGYHAAAIGKIYHGVFPDGASITKWDTMGDPQSWSVPAIRFGPRYYYTEEGITAAKKVFERIYRPKDPAPDDWTKKLVFGPATEAPDVPDDTLYDGQVAKAAVKALGELKERNQPFFLAVGFIKPHSPYIAPKKYFDLYPNASLPTGTDFPTDAPRFSGHGSGELRRYTDQPKSGEIAQNNQRRVRQAYFACVSYIDAQIGRVLDALDQNGLKENTVVVLFGDHGYHLGEQGLWGKTTNFELDTRVPLIIRAPGMKSPGKSTSSLVELVDLYPSLVELAGMSRPDRLDGKSLFPALNNPKQSSKRVALSQYPRGGGLMGYSMRTPTHRLTQWIHQKSRSVRATELYDYSNGLNESKNVAKSNPGKVAELAKQLNVAFNLEKVSASPDKGESNSESFENLKPGPFEKIKTLFGTLHATVGNSIVDDGHAKTGQQCLQIKGGEESAVILEFKDGIETSGEMTFWAERWTKRTPFSFRIESYNGKSWKEIYDGDETVKVGRGFQSRIRVPLRDASIERLRFVVKSPKNTGVLIDDIQLNKYTPPKKSKDENKSAPNKTSPGESVSGQPNIVFIISEDNSEHLGCYGESRVHTPHLDKLAAGGIRYTRAYVPYSVCSPSRAAFLTGLYTRQTGHIGLATHRFSMYRDFKTLPAYFQQAGYYTGFLGKTHVNPERVVEDFIDQRAIRNSNFGKTISIEKYAEEAHAVMQKAKDKKKPFLLIVNYADAHRKYVGKSKNGFPSRQVTDLIEPFPWIGSDTEFLRAELRDYFNCMNRLDEGIGMLFEKLEETGTRDNTLIVYISDHGADFPRGKGSIYENGTRIPMIVNYPKNFTRGKVERGMVSTIDILPTMLRAAGLEIPEHLPGVPLQDIDSGRTPSRKFIHTFTTGSSPNLLYVQFGIRDDRYKLVYNPDRALNKLAESRYRNSKLPTEQVVESFVRPPEYELFDLEKDPHEWKNLANSAEHQEVRQRLLKAMRDFQREIKDPFAESKNVNRFISEQKEYLNKPYKKPGFRWPHLDMFREAQEQHD